MKARFSLHLNRLLLLTILVLAVGCAKAPTDTQIANDIQNKLNTDSGLQGKQLAVQSDKGSVTLSGQVDNEAQRDAQCKGAVPDDDLVEGSSVARCRPGDEFRIGRVPISARAAHDQPVTAGRA